MLQPGAGVAVGEGYQFWGFGAADELGGGVKVCMTDVDCDCHSLPYALCPMPYALPGGHTDPEGHPGPREHRSTRPDRLVHP